MGGIARQGGGGLGELLGRWVRRSRQAVAQAECGQRVMAATEAAVARHLYLALTLALSVTEALLWYECTIDIEPNLC